MWADGEIFQTVFSIKSITWYDGETKQSDSIQVEYKSTYTGIDQR